MTLYELTGQYKALYELMTQGDIDEQTLNDTLESVDFVVNLESKVDGYGYVYKQLEADEAVLKAEIDRLTAKKKAVENSKKGLKNRLMEAMKGINRDELKTALFNFKICKSTPAVVIDENATIPAYAIIAQPGKVSKDILAERLRQGEEIPGIRIEQGEHIRIK